MPVTELLVIQFLVESTRSQTDSLLWRELDGGGYRTEIKGVRVELMNTHTTTGARLCVLLAAGVEKVYVSEPASASVWRTAYSTDDERALAEQMKILFRSVSSQCAARQLRTHDQYDEVRQEIFHQLLFGRGNGQDPEQSA